MTEIKLNVPVERFDELKKEVKAVATKFKVTGSLFKGEKSVAKVYDPFSRKRVKHPVYACRIVISDAEMVKFEGTGETFLGSIFKEDVVTVGSTPEGREKGVSLATLSAEIKAMACARCGKKTPRKKLYVFDTPEGIKTYGTTCAKTKFGVNFELIIGRFVKMRDYFTGWVGTGERLGHEADAWMKVTLREIAEKGHYISKGKAWDHARYGDGSYMPSTDSVAWSDYYLLMYGANDNWEMDRLKELMIYLEDETPFPVADFAGLGLYNESKVDTSDFDFNMKASLELITEHGLVTPRTSGYIAYAVFRLWKKSLEVKKAPWNEKHGYSKGMKLKDLRLTVIKEVCFETAYGEKAIYTLRDNNNVRLKWFTDPKFDVDDKIVLSSVTIKELEDHVKYGKAVVLTRGRVKVRKNRPVKW